MREVTSIQSKISFVCFLFTDTTHKFFLSQSYMDWALQQQFRDSLVSRRMDVQLIYRTRDTNGMIFHVTGEGIGEFIKLEVESNVPSENFSLDLKGNMCLPAILLVCSNGFVK